MKAPRNYLGHEWQTLQFSVFWIFDAIAGIDGTIDEQEFEVLKTKLVTAYLSADALAKAVLQSVESEFELLRPSYEKDPRDVDAGLGDVVALLRKRATPADAQAVKVTLYQLGEAIANASGGFFGFGSKISKSERKALDRVALLLELDRKAV